MPVREPIVKPVPARSAASRRPSLRSSERGRRPGTGIRGLLLLGLIGLGAAAAEPVRAVEAEVSAPWSGGGAGETATASGEGARRPAVARPNLRLEADYSYLHVDPTETTASGPPLTTLRIPNLDAHAVDVALVGVVPLTRATGARLEARGRWGHTQRSVDGLSRGNDESSGFGAGTTLFVRDPALGALEIGGGYDRQLGDGDVEADVYRGSARLAIFFPDLDLGPVDWFVRFDFAHRRISGAPGTTDLDGDRYAVEGGAGWYLSDDLQVVLGGRWIRAEEEFLDEEDRVGFGRLRWRLPLPGPVSAELRLGGHVGVSAYEQSPFRSDHRLVYGARAGLVLRVGSGASLLESIRAYD